ncbi:MAG TPA: hypothetical protein VJ929_12455 [Roseovarius sp.]|nr:hypothetical protein [Roseovarius sp.]
MTASETYTASNTDEQHSDSTEKDPDIAIAGPILLTVVMLVAAWAGSFVMWGVPGLYIPAVAMVPVMMAVLVWISRG